MLNSKPKDAMRTVAALMLALASMSAMAQTAKWKRYVVGVSHASMELPAEPRTKRALIQGEALETLQFQESSSSLGPGFFVLITYAEYQPGKRPDLKTAVKGLAGNLYDASSGKAKPVTKSMKVSGKNAMLETVSYSSNGQQQSLKQVLIADGTKFWQVAIAYTAGNKDASAAADRIIGSIVIK